MLISKLKYFVPKVFQLIRLFRYSVYVTSFALIYTGLIMAHSFVENNVFNSVDQVKSALGKYNKEHSTDIIVPRF